MEFERGSVFRPQILLKCDMKFLVSMSGVSLGVLAPSPSIV
jgi:hypothetical protein